MSSDATCRALSQGPVVQDGSIFMSVSSRPKPNQHLPLRLHTLPAPQPSSAPTAVRPPLVPMQATPRPGRKRWDGGKRGKLPFDRQLKLKLEGGRGASATRGCPSRLSACACSIPSDGSPAEAVRGHRPWGLTEGGGALLQRRRTDGAPPLAPVPDEFLSSICRAECPRSGRATPRPTRIASLGVDCHEVVPA